MLKQWLSANRNDILFIIFCWFVVSIVLFSRNWGDISALKLADNDDYMRFVQFTDWLKFGNWYLEPMPRFNPEDGLIIHWSRLPDLLLAGLTLVFTPILGATTAPLFSISVTPLLYLLIFSLSMFALCDRYLGKDYRFIGMIFALGSPAVAKFLPGSIDHHNLQLIFAALFLLLTPLNVDQIKHHWRAMLQAFVIALSLWTGLENITLFVVYLALYTFYCYYFDDNWLSYFSKLCFFSFAFTLIACLINRPPSEFFIAQYDAISFPFTLCFLGGGVALFLSNKAGLQQRSFMLSTGIGLATFLLCFTPILIQYPQLIKGAYSDYPPLLLDLWLSKVSEAQSMLSLIKSNGFFSIDNYWLYFIPALLYPLFKNKNLQLNILYIVLVTHLLLAMFWQIRAINLCFILSAPLQVYVLLNLTNKIKKEWLKIPVLVAGIPFTIIIVLVLMKPPSASSNEIEGSNEKSDLVALLQENQVTHAKILSGIETGAKILATTDNSIVAAPYHRNIQGNRSMINTYLETDLNKVKEYLILNEINYIIINNDSQLTIIQKESLNESFINHLQQTTIPLWITKISGESRNEYALFKVEIAQ